MTSIYFPLGSNVHYWDLTGLDLDLESRIKLSALIYDNIVFEDGGFIAYIGPQLSLEQRFALDQVPVDYISEHEQLPREGGSFFLEFNGVRIESQAQRRYSLSYRLLLEKLDLINQSWVQFSEYVPSEGAKKYLKKISDDDIKLFYDNDRETYLLQQSIIRILNYDWFLSTNLNWDINLDPIHQTYLEQKLNLYPNQSQDYLPPINFELIFPKLPLLREVSWDKILQVREHSLAKEFRSSLVLITGKTRQAYLEGEKADSIRGLVNDWFSDQLLDALEDQLITGKKTTTKILTSIGFLIGSFFPLVGPIIGLADSTQNIIESISEYVNDKNTIGAYFIQRKKKQ